MLSLNKRYKHPSMGETAYRPDIDGMRALAILSVLAYHAFPGSVHGGFVGVDIFFVISGYLITSIILRSIDSGTFTITRFYMRRIRRIFPALLLVLLACLVMGWFLFSPSEYMRVGKHVVGGAGFVSNFVFWSESGYFDAAAEVKPLLHLWSLGIEEQFYMFWPILLYSVTRYKRLQPLHAILVILIVSFCLNIVKTTPFSYSAFYSPATRVWELAIGGALAHIFSSKRPEDDNAAIRRSTRIRLANWGHWAELKALVGFGLILLAVLWINRQSPYPGWRALLPTAGAALIISAGPSAWLNRVVLSNPILVFVGLISYPLYLWHWPLLSFAYVVNSGVLSTGLRSALLSVSAVLASLTFLLVERPINSAKVRPSIVLALLGLMVFVGGSGALVYSHHGFQLRVPAKARTTMALRSDTNHSPGIVVAPIGPGIARAPTARGRSETVPETFPTKHMASLLAERHSDRVRPAPSPLALYKERVANAKLRVPNRTDPYLDEIWNGRLAAVRTNTCDLGLNQPYEALRDESVCGAAVEGKRNIVVIGDSIAADTYFWLKTAYPEYNFIQKTGTGCNLQRGSANSEACRKQIDSGVSIFQSGTVGADAIVLASLWNSGYTAIDGLLGQLKAKGKPVILVGPPMELTVLVWSLLERYPAGDSAGPTMKELDGYVRAHIKPEIIALAKTMKEFAAEKHIQYIDVYAIGCSELTCPVLDETGQLLLADDAHRSAPGGRWLGMLIRRNRVLEKILGE